MRVYLDLEVFIYTISLYANAFVYRDILAHAVIVQAPLASLKQTLITALVANTCEKVLGGGISTK